jgi:membrane-bound metal-dependent hydrolase YbcI (DUF457 family)
VTVRGHLLGGALAGLGVAAAAARLGWIANGDHRAWAVLMGATAFCSLFPDLDTSSVPQRWFYRLVFAGLLYLGWTERYSLALVVAILALLPVVDHHRGWTHWKASPLLVPLLLGGLYEYWRIRHAGAAPSSWAELRLLLGWHPVVLGACTVGWYTHLLLDGCFRVFPVERGHH